MHAFDLILTLTGCFSAALIFGYLTQKVGLSPIVGYLLAGVVVGPHTPGFVADTEMAEAFAEVGVILLMFGVGLQFHIEELLAVRRVAIPGAVAQSAAATSLGVLLARLLGWSWASGLIFGVALSVASTVVLVRVLSDNRALHTTGGHIAVGWLVVEDLVTVVALVVLPIVLGPTASTGAELGLALLLMVVKVAALVAFTAVVGTRVIPAVLDRVSRTGSRELFTLTVLVIALGIAVGSAIIFGVSVALGAFLAGLVVGRSDYSLRAASEALPLRDAFAVLFFVSVGMLLDPEVLLQDPTLLAGTLAVVMMAKPVVAFAITWILRYPLLTSLSVAVALAQIGEFSFMLSRVGEQLGVLDPMATDLLVAAAIISIIANPILYRTIRPVERWVQGQPALARLLDPSAPREIFPSPKTQPDPAHRAVVVGYGPSGRAVTRLLQENDITPTIIELNLPLVRQLRESGIEAIYGDATQRTTLEAAGVGQAAHLVLTSAGMERAIETIRIARELNPNIHVLARAPTPADLRKLREAGAESVFSAEGAVALALTEAILQRLGATPEQIDHERERVRQELRG